jgi:hypothetical protein
VQYLCFAIALALGLVLAYVDSRPNWDDTGVMAAALLIGCGIFGALRPRTPWLWALAIGLWIPAIGIIRTQNYSALIALAIAFAGAYAGMGIRRALAPA